jgi:hypothetical protein
MGDGAGGPAGTLADRLSETRRKSFTGRRGERALFAAALAGDSGAFSVLYLYGPGGIGKSTLLHQLASDARDAGRPVTELDARLVDATPQSFEAAAGPLAVGGSVLLIDTFEKCQGLETWLSQRFLPRLPSDAIVVIASRCAPDPAWRADTAWSDALRVITLRNLDPADSAALMTARGVAAELQPSLLEFAGGHPLALTLAAEVAASGSCGPQSWAPDQDVVGTLLSRLVGELPSPQHRHALELCAHVEFVTEDLLRAALPGDTAGLFEWLRGLPFTETSPGGVFPHDIVRTALEADLRWRDPDGYAAMHYAVRPYLIGRVREAAAPDVLDATRAFLFIYRRSPAVTGYFGWWRGDDVYMDRYRGSDRPQLLAMTAEAQGPGSATLAGYWLDRQPGAFQVCRRGATGSPVAFGTWLRLTADDKPGACTDPIVTAAWAHSQAYGGPRPGEHLGLLRFMIHQAPHDGHRRHRHLSPASELMQTRVVSEWLRQQGLAWSFITEPGPGYWRDQLEITEHGPISARPEVGGRSYALFAHDWRRAPLEPWLDRQSARAVAGSGTVAADEPIAFPVLSRPEFDQAVRAALRSLHSAALAGNVLARSRLAAHRGGQGQPEVLRELLTGMIGSMSTDPKEAKLHRVLDATYLRPAPTQEAAAALLRLPFSTYRRHLANGLELVSDRLWARELGAGDLRG